MRHMNHPYGIWWLAIVCQIRYGQGLSVKNLLYICVDDLTANLKVFGGDYDVPTPNLDRLRQESLHLTRAYSQEAVCSPSRNSFLSGMRPDTTKAFTFMHSFRDTFPNSTSLPQMFKEHNFTTCGSGKIFHDNMPADDDFPYSWSYERCGEYANPDQDICPGPSMWCAINSTEVEEDTAFVDAKIANAAIGHFKLVQKFVNPWAVFVGFRKPHVPWYIPKRFLEMQPAMDDIPLPKNQYFPTDTPVVAWLNSSTAEFADDPDIAHMNPYIPIPDSLTRLMKQHYFGAVSFMDYQVGRVLDSLESEGLMNDTVIILHADHGYQLGEHNSWSKSTNWEMSTRVPLLVRVPGSPPRDPQSVDTPVNLLDLYRTLGELFSLTVTPDVEGASFVNLLTKDGGRGGAADNTTEERFATSWFPRCISGDATVAAGFGPVPEYIWADCAMYYIDSIDKLGLTVRGDKWRYTEWRNWVVDDLDVDWSDEGLYGVELYHHLEDGTIQTSDDENVNMAFNDSVSLEFKQRLAVQLRTLFRGPTVTPSSPVEEDQSESVTEATDSGDLDAFSSNRLVVVTLLVGASIGVMMTILGLLVLWPRISRRRHSQGAISEGPLLTDSFVSSQNA